MWKLLNVESQPDDNDMRPINFAALAGADGLAAEDPPPRAPTPATTSAPAGPYVYTSPNISSYAMSSKGCASIGFDKILDVKTEGECHYFVIDVSAYTDHVDITTAADDKTLILTRHGIGFRVAIVAWNMKVESTANLGMVAASAQLGAGQSSLIAKAFAGDLTMLGDIAEITKYNSEKFDAQMLKNLAGFVGKLAGLIATKGSSIPPTPVMYAALNPNMYNPMHVVASNTFAAEQLARGIARSGLENWMAGRYHEAWRKDIFIPSVIDAAYQNFGVLNFHGTGSDEQRSAANVLKSLGDN